jgi:serine/threonine protein kinase
MIVPTPPPAAPGPNAPLACAATASLSLPRSFGRYTLFELVGKGGMAEIYLARAETELGATRLAVVKQILPAFADDPRFEEMLTHEAKLAARLSHARVVQVFDLGRADGHLFIAMEYVEGFDLNALLRHCTERRVGLPVEHALGIVADVLEGLDYAHRLKSDDGKLLGLVHRDVSPSNILISYEGEVKLCDFGIAHANDLVREGASEALKGKAGYMSPEHARGEPLDARADVFAAGIVLWELLAGHRLYRPKGAESLLEQARRAEIPPLLEKGLPNEADLAQIASRALAPDREQRYPSALAMLRDLEGYLSKSGLLASRLKLGEWISTSFGTETLEQRRASERRLPKSTPPPRPSFERLRATLPSRPPSPSSSPMETASVLLDRDHDLLDERFAQTPSDPPVVVKGVVALAPPMTTPRPASSPESPELPENPENPEGRSREVLAAAPAPLPPPSSPLPPSSSSLDAAAEVPPPPSSSELPNDRPSSPSLASEPRISEARRKPLSLVPVSSGAMRAFKRELEDAKSALPPFDASLAAIEASSPAPFAPASPGASPEDLARASRSRLLVTVAFVALVIALVVALLRTGR